MPPCIPAFSVEHSAPQGWGGPVERSGPGVLWEWLGSSKKPAVVFMVMRRRVFGAEFFNPSSAVVMFRYSVSVKS